LGLGRVTVACNSMYPVIQRDGTILVTGGNVQFHGKPNRHADSIVD
jgi:hypothetical protein